MPRPRTIQIHNAAGDVIASAPAKSNAARHSVQAAADQRQINAMYTPTATEAVILFGMDSTGHKAHFRFDAQGRSQFYFPQEG